MFRGAPLAGATLLLAVLGGCSTDSTTTADTATSTSEPASTTMVPPTSTAGSTTTTAVIAATTIAATTIPTTTPTATTPVTTAAEAPTTTATPTPTTLPPAASNKVIIQAAGFLVPQGDYSFEDAPDDTVASWQSLLDASAVVRAQAGTIGGVDVYDNAGQNIGRVFLFVPDARLAAGSTADLQPFVAAEADPAPSPATLAGASGVTWRTGETSFFLADDSKTIVWVLAASAANLEPALTDLLDSLGG